MLVGATTPAVNVAKAETAIRWRLEEAWIRQKRQGERSMRRGEAKSARHATYARASLMQDAEMGRAKRTEETVSRVKTSHNASQKQRVKAVEPVKAMTRSGAQPANWPMNERELREVSGNGLR